MVLENDPMITENNDTQILPKSTNGFSSNNGNGTTDPHKNGVHLFNSPNIERRRQLPPDATMLDRVKFMFSCPPHGIIGRWISYFMLVAIFWGTLVGITEEKALPGGTLFSLLVLVATAHIAGVLVEKIHLPPLLGMLVVGILYRSLSPFNIIGASIESSWSSALRGIALVVILIRAGLGLDPAALRKLSFVVLRLAATPCLVETVAVAVMSKILLDFPWKWAFMLGFVLAAISPAVVVPCLLSFSEQGYGLDKGIPTLVIAAASIDDVIAISGFGIVMGITFSTGSPVWQGIKGPMEFGAGVLYGVIVGLILWIIPNKDEKNSANMRFFLLLVSGLFAIFGSKIIDFGGAGAMGCLCVAFVAGVGWRKQANTEDLTIAKYYFNTMWQFFQPMLFGLIGTEIDVSNLDPNTIGLGMACLAVGLSIRIVVSFFAVFGGDLNFKERLFVALAWLPKATVQAAIGSTALDYARSADGNDDFISEEERMGKQILTIAVLAILVTAPIGSIAIMLSAPKLLNRKQPDTQLQTLS